jgi:hypothetical protein
MKKYKTKQKGTILLISVFLSTLILVTGSGLANLLVKEIQFSSDFLFAEKSYYAAESGVEKALFALNSSPIQNIINENIPIGTAETMLNIKNAVNTFSVELPPNKTVKLRLKIDDDGTFNESIRPISLENLTFNFTDFTTDSFQWKILCEKSGSPISLQDVLSSASPTFKNFQGIKETITNNSPNVSVETFWNALSETEKKSCFLSLQNLNESDTLKFNINLANNFSPSTATITSHGIAGKREKIIKFDYKQKNLASFFDFSFFHSDDGI